MTSRSRKLLQLSPRILGILVCLFLGMFSLDAFGSGKTFVAAIADFAIHLTPALILLAVVVVAWRWEWVGALVFIGVAVAYAFSVRTHISWIPVISGPLLIVGMLFFWSWIQRKEFRAPA
jgi:hypothetical protein